MEKLTAANVRRALEAAGLMPDKVSRKADGSFEVKRGYFYHLGNTSKTWAAEVGKAAEAASLPLAVVRSRDDWRAWPRDSYLVAVLKDCGSP